MKVLYVGESTGSFFLADISKEYELEEIELTTSQNMHVSNLIQAATINSYAHILVDVSFLIGETEPIIQALRQVATTCNSNVIIIAPGYRPNSNLIQGAYLSGFKNFIIANVLGDIKDQAYKCMTGYYEANGIPWENDIMGNLDDSSSDIPSDITLESINQAKSRKISIGVAGATHRIGCTTQALQICKFIQSKGYNPCYIAFQGNLYWKKFMENMDESEFSFTKDQGLLRVCNVDIYIDSNQIPMIRKKDYDFFVYDFGSLTDSTFEHLAFLEKDLDYIMCGSKPNEFDETCEAIYRTKDQPNIHFMFSFVDENEQSDINNMMASLEDRTSFAPCTYSLFNYVTAEKNPYYAIEHFMLEEKESILSKKKKKRFGRKKSLFSK